MAAGIQKEIFCFFLSEGLAGRGQRALVSRVQLYFRALLLQTLTTASISGEGRSGACWRQGGSHTAYQWRIQLFVPNRVNARCKEKQKAPLLAAGRSEAADSLINHCAVF